MPVGKLAKDWGPHAAGVIVTTSAEEAEKAGTTGFVLVAGVRFEFLRSNAYLEKPVPASKLAALPKAAAEVPPPITTAAETSGDGAAVKSEGGEADGR